MRITAKASYACLAMLELAAHHSDSQPVQLKTIARAHRIPPRFLVQILLQLKAVGLVSSTRGSFGGYQLARPPGDISLAEVINAIDRNSAAPPGPLATPRSPTAKAVRDLWDEIQSGEQRALEEITLAELARRTLQTGVATYQI
ncbi:MAG TPA: Rrf2 family transcriptional regulator [Gemmataceae bacterium]|jgi:Rrf2 family cysteine metabolism transcriptional repressor|nr:Rrf2 family transcriptional regulator [Gemmataceae bacterium]